MDPAHVFRQGLGSVAPRQQQHQQQYQTLNIPSRPPVTQDDLSDQGDGSGRIAHTLTACCRCRQVRIYMLPIELSLTQNRGKQDAIRHYLDVSLASDLVRYANTSIRPKVVKSTATMSSNCKIRLEFSRLSSRSMLMTRPITPTTAKIWFDQEAWFGSAQRTRRLDTSDPAVALR